MSDSKLQEQYSSYFREEFLKYTDQHFLAKCKERLKLLNYIKCNNNRNDYTIRKGKDISKVIRFVKKAVDDQINILDKPEKADA